MRRRRTVWAASAGLLAVSVGLWVVPASGATNATLAISDVAANEGQAGTSTFSFTVALSGSARGTISVTYATSSGSATSPGDFTDRSGTLVLSKRQRTARVNVSVVGDTTVEADEQFSVRLSNAAGATIARAVGVGTILNDDVTPLPGDPVIAAAGDIACDPTSSAYNGGQGTATECRQLATSDLLVNGTDAAVLLLGDNQYENGALVKYQQSYETSWGRVKANTRPVPGNHDYGTTGAAGYYDYFGTAAGDRTKGYYSFDVGAWHLVALNSNCAAIGGCAAGSAQEQWLRADLSAHPAACTLAFWHHPRFSSGLHGSDASTAALWQALYDANADVVLNGHDHDYERFAPQNPSGVADGARGVRQFVVGSGGRSHYATGTPKPNSEVRDSTSFGILRLTLRANGYEWAFRPAVGTFTDNGTGACH
ncbi:MAG: Calx-beta domain-containing protein [Acidimicrobiia bacterium]